MITQNRHLSMAVATAQVWMLAGLRNFATAGKLGSIDDASTRSGPHMRKTRLTSDGKSGTRPQVHGAHDRITVAHVDYPAAMLQTATVRRCYYGS